MEPTPKFPGKPIEMGGRQFVVPAMSLGLIERYWPVITGEVMKDPAATDPRFFMGKCAEFIWEALKRNYPDLTLAEVKEMLDLMSVQTMVQAICEASGLVQKKPEGPTPATPPPTAPSPSTG